MGVPYGENKRKIFELVPPGGYWRDIDPEIAKSIYEKLLEYGWRKNWNIKKNEFR